MITSRNAYWPARLGVQRLLLGTLARPYSVQVLLTPRAAAQGQPLANLLTLFGRYRINPLGA